MSILTTLVCMLMHCASLLCDMSIGSPMGLAYRHTSIDPFVSNWKTLWQRIGDQAYLPTPDLGEYVVIAV